MTCVKITQILRCKDFNLCIHWYVVSTEISCAVPAISNGYIQCTDVAGDETLFVPTHTDICYTTCDIGFMPSAVSATCIVTANTGVLNDTLSCEGDVFSHL